MVRPKREASTQDENNASEFFISEEMNMEAAETNLEQSESLWLQLCSQIDSRCETDVKEMKQKTDSRVLALKYELNLVLNQIPTLVKDMPISEFRDKYGGDINAVLRRETVMEPNEAKELQSERTPLHIRNDSLQDNSDSSLRRSRRLASKGTSIVQDMKSARKALPLSTPNPPGNPAFLTATPGTQRLPKVGEMFFSANGSPLGVFGDTMTPISDNVTRFGKENMQAFVHGNEEDEDMPKKRRQRRARN